LVEFGESMTASAPRERIGSTFRVLQTPGDFSPKDFGDLTSAFTHCGTDMTFLSVKVQTLFS
jgi:hypothetical protein